MSIFMMIWKGIRYVTFQLMKVTVLGNRHLFYTRFFGCDNKALLLIKNVVNPSRLASKIRYGSIALLPPALRKGEAAPPLALTREALEQARLLGEQGYLVFDGARPDVADHVLKLYAAFLKTVKPATHYYNLILREVDQVNLRFMTDEKLLQIMAAHYNGRQPYLRSAAALKSTWPVANRASSRESAKTGFGFNVDWHYDTVNMLQIHFLLHDLTVEDTHMALVANEARTHRVPLTPEDYTYSDEYIARNYRTVPLVGRKGTIFLWDSNAPHSAMLRKDRPRHMVQMLYSPGNDILTENPKFGKDWAVAPEGLDLQSLPEISRQCLKFVLDDRPPHRRTLSADANREGTVYAQKLKGEFEVSHF